MICEVVAVGRLNKRQSGDWRSKKKKGRRENRAPFSFFKLIRCYLPFLVELFFAGFFFMSCLRIFHGPAKIPAVPIQLSHK